MPSPPHAAPASRKWLAMLGVGLGVFMSTLDAGIVNIALPTLVGQLHTTFSMVQWVVLSYLLVLTSAMLSVARLGDMLGKKPIYMIGVVIFTLGSVLCGMAPGVEWLIAFRALQGVGAVMSTALGTAIITEVFPQSERGRALGIIGGIVSVGIALGPSVGGVLIGLVGWRSIFWVNLPVGMITLYFVQRGVPALRRGAPGQRFDIAGALILFATLGSYALGMTFAQNSGFANPWVGGLLVTAGLGLVALLLVEWRVAQPMIDLRLFRNPLLGLNLLMGFTVFTVTAGMFVMPFFLQLVQGYRTEQMGLLTAVVPVATGLIAPVAGNLSDRFGSRGISLIGLALVIGACLLISTLHAEVAPLGYVLRLAPLGLGLGFFQSPNNSAIMGAAPRERLGLVSGLLSLSRTLGQTTGLPLMGMIFSSQLIAAGGMAAGGDIMVARAAGLVQALQGTFRVAAAGVLVAELLAILAWVLDRRRKKAATA
jgi:EmrB/QacA subfamily drug resistance transporter